MIPSGSTTKRALIAAFTIVAASLAGACAGKDQPAPAAASPDKPVVASTKAVAPTIRTDSGIEIAHFDTTAFAATTQYTVDPTPIAVLDTHDVNYDYDVSRIDRGFFLKDNSFVSNSSMSSKTIVFDTAGRPLRILAQFDTKDGDVGRLQTASRTPQDTIIVVDFSNRRINYYTAQKFVRYEPLGSVYNERAFRLAGKLQDGTLILHNAGDLPDQYPNGRSKPDAMIMAMNAKGLSGAIAFIPDITIATMRTNWDGKAGRMPLAIRLGPEARVIVWDSLIATGNGERFRIDLRNGDGKITSVIEIDAAPRLTTQANRDADLAIRLAEMEYYDGKDAMKGEPLRLRKAWPVADTIAAFGGLFLTPTNTLWVADPAVPGEKVWHATAFNSKREMIGRLTFSGDGSPIAFSDDRVIVRTATVDDIATLRIFRLIAAPATAARPQ